jgi:hypothetical protein
MSYQYINNLMIPMLGLYKNELEKKPTADKNTFNNIMRKMNELNFSIAQCQETVTVPEVKLEIYPKIRDIVAKKEKDRYLNDPELITADDLTRMSDDFSKWLRDIYTLLKHQFDLMSSTALQEQIYWSTYSASLRDAESQIKSEECQLYKEIMQKKGKFHLKANFDSIETQLKESAEKATDINGFFKELRLQELMTAQTIDEMATILVPLLTQLKRLNTFNNPKEKYDYTRIYQLI